MDWLTRPENFNFARATANRLWAQLMGRGLVHPVDNLSASDPPSHPELLDSLSAWLAKHDVDVKKWFRVGKFLGAIGIAIAGLLLRG